MQIDIGALSGVVLAGSLAMERLVTTVKTLLPRFFAEAPLPPHMVAATAVERPGPLLRTGQALRRGTEPLRSSPSDRKRPPAYTSDYSLDQGRRFRVLGLVFLASFITAYYLSDVTSCGAGTAAQCRQVQYGSGRAMPWYLFAVLISGGSAFWTNIVGFVSAAKDARGVQKRIAQQQLSSNARLE